VKDASMVLARKQRFAKTAFVKNKTGLNLFFEKFENWSKISARKQPSICISLRKQERPKNFLLWRRKEETL